MMQTDKEMIARQAAFREFCEAIGDAGFHKPPADWSPGEAKAIAERTVTAFTRKFWGLYDDAEAPF